ncbi:hypothetical protein [Paenibacillus sp. GCM10012306]
MGERIDLNIEVADTVGQYVGLGAYVDCDVRQKLFKDQNMDAIELLR